MTDINTVLAELKRGTDEILSEADLIENWKRIAHLKLNLVQTLLLQIFTLGHTVVLNKLRQFPTIRPPKSIS